MADVATAPDDKRYYQLTNLSKADVIYPVVFDNATGVVIWDGQRDPQKANYRVQPNGNRVIVDLSQVSTPPVNETKIYFGASIEDIPTPVYDKTSVFTYVKTSTDTADGYYTSRDDFKVDKSSTVLAATGLDSKTFQNLYSQTNTPAVARLLVALANLISPEI